MYHVRLEALPKIAPQRAKLGDRVSRVYFSPLQFASILPRRGIFPFRDFLVLYFFSQITFLGFQLQELFRILSKLFSILVNSDVFACQIQVIVDQV